jgi:hypothetical protein
MEIRRGVYKSLAFPISWFATQPKECFLDGLKKLEQRNHKCVCGAQGEYVNIFFHSRSLLFSLQSQRLTSPLVPPSERNPKIQHC